MGKNLNHGGGDGGDDGGDDDDYFDDFDDGDEGDDGGLFRRRMILQEVRGLCKWKLFLLNSGFILQGLLYSIMSLIIFPCCPVV